MKLNSMIVKVVIYRIESDFKMHVCQGLVHILIVPKLPYIMYACRAQHVLVVHHKLHRFYHFL